MFKSENYIFIGIGFVIVLVWLVVYTINPEHLQYLDVLFASLSFLGVIWAVIVQKQELRLQREELESTRAVFKEQSSTSRKQRFENSFFQLINVYVDRERSLSYKGKTGGETFTTFVGMLSSDWQGHSRLLEHGKYQEYEERVFKEYCEKRVETDSSRFMTHFNNAFLIMDFIQKSNLVEDNEKVFYFDILKSQLSQNELYLLKLESKIRKEFQNNNLKDFFKDAKHPNVPNQSPPTLQIFPS